MAPTPPSRSKKWVPRHQRPPPSSPGSGSQGGSAAHSLGVPSSPGSGSHGRSATPSELLGTGGGSSSSGSKTPKALTDDASSHPTPEKWSPSSPTSGSHGGSSEGRAKLDTPPSMLSGSGGGSSSGGKRKAMSRAGAHGATSPGMKWVEKPPTPPCGIKLPKPALLDADDVKNQLVSFLHSTDLTCSVGTVRVLKFGDLLLRNKDLAILICSGNSSWTNALLAEAGEEIYGAKIFIERLPDRVYDAKELFKSVPDPLTTVLDVFRGNATDSVKVATFRGRLLFRLIVWEVVEHISKGESFLGQLSIDNFVFLEEDENIHAFICKTPAVTSGATSMQKVLDVNNLWPMLEPFILGADGELPLFFQQLKDFVVSATESELLLYPWYLDLLKYFPAFASSKARSDYITSTFRAVRSFGLQHRLPFRPHLQRKPDIDDWRKKAKRNKLIQKIYSHTYSNVVFNNPGLVVVTKGENDEELAPKEEDDEKEVTVLHVAETEEGVDELDIVVKGDVWETFKDGRASFEKPTRVVVSRQQVQKLDEADTYMDDKDAYDDTMVGLLTLKRHSLTHLHEHVKLSALHDIEIYNAKVFGGSFLPDLMKDLLKEGVKGTNLETTWFSYKASIGDPSEI